MMCFQFNCSFVLLFLYIYIDRSIVQFLVIACIHNICMYGIVDKNKIIFNFLLFVIHYTLSFVLSFFRFFSYRYARTHTHTHVHKHTCIHAYTFSIHCLYIQSIFGFFLFSSFLFFPIFLLVMFSLFTVCIIIIIIVI